MTMSLRDLFGGRRRMVLRAQEEREQLEQLLARFREERVHIDSLLTKAMKRTDDLAHLAGSLDELTGKRDDAAAALAVLEARFDAFDHRLSMVERSEQHVEAVRGALAVLRKGVEELQRRQAEVERLSDKLEVDRRALENFEEHVRRVIEGTEH